MKEKQKRLSSSHPRQTDRDNFEKGLVVSVLLDLEREGERGEGLMGFKVFFVVFFLLFFKL